MEGDYKLNTNDMKRKLYRLWCWIIRKCPDGHGCPPKIANIIKSDGGYGGGGC